MPGHRHRSPVLDRYREDLRLTGEMHGQFIAKGRSQDIVRRTTVHLCRPLGRIDLGLLVDIGAGGQQPVIGILDIIDEPTLFTIEPDISDHAMRRWYRTRRQRYMPDNGFGIGVPVVSIVVMDTLVHQVAKSTFTHHIFITARQITAQGVNGNLYDQFWWIARVGKSCTAKQGCQADDQQVERTTMQNEFHGLGN